MLRALTITSPAGVSSIELAWKKSCGLPSFGPVIPSPTSKWSPARHSHSSSAGRDVDLLYPRVDDRAVGRAADAREVGRALDVERHVGGAARGQLEVVVIAQLARDRSDARDHPVVLVHHDVDAVAVAEVGVALPPGQHRSASVPLDLEGGRGPVAADGVEPDRPPAAVDDHRPVLPGAALDGEEDRPARDAVGGRRGDRQRVRVEAGPRVELLRRDRDRLRLRCVRLGQLPRDRAAGDERERQHPEPDARTSRRGRPRGGGAGGSVGVPVTVMRDPVSPAPLKRRVRGGAGARGAGVLMSSDDVFA